MNAISSRIQGSGSTRNILDPRKVTPEAAAHAGAFHAEVVSAIEQAIEAQPLVVVGMAQNPWVKKVRQALDEAGVAFTYIEYGSYFSKWKERLAIKLWSGWPTFPQVFVRGTLIGGFQQTRSALSDGSLKRLLTQTTPSAFEVQA